MQNNLFVWKGRIKIMGWKKTPCTGIHISVFWVKFIFLFFFPAISKSTTEKQKWGELGATLANLCAFSSAMLKTKQLKSHPSYKETANELWQWWSQWYCSFCNICMKCYVQNSTNLRSDALCSFTHCESMNKSF